MQPWNRTYWDGINYTDNGLYTVKSGYWLATHLRDQDEVIVPPPWLPEFKTTIWKFNTTSKIKHFLSIIFSNAMTVGNILTH